MFYLKAEMSKYLPLGLLIVVVLLMELAIGLAIWVPADGAAAARAAPTPLNSHNTAALGLLLYDKYFLLFHCIYFGQVILIDLSFGRSVCDLRPGGCLRSRGLDVKSKEEMVKL